MDRAPYRVRGDTWNRGPSHLFSCGQNSVDQGSREIPYGIPRPPTVHIENLRPYRVEARCRNRDDGSVPLIQTDNVHFWMELILALEEAEIRLALPARITFPEGIYPGLYGVDTLQLRLVPRPFPVFDVEHDSEVRSIAR